MSIRIISDIWELFFVDECVVCRLVVDKSPIFINSDLLCGIQNDIAHVHYAGVNLLHTIFDRFSLWDLLCWGLAEHAAMIWWLAPFLGGGSHHETARSVFDIHQWFLVSSTRGLIGRFILLHLPECLCILFDLGLSWTVTVAIITAFLSTVVASNVIQISPGSLLLLFSTTFVVPSFPALRKHELVADPVGLRISIRFIIRSIN